MTEKKQDQQKIIKNIMQVAPKHCENCGVKYNSEDFKVMRNTSINTLLHLKCSSCGNTYMLNVVSPMQGMVGASRIPLNLDLDTVDEVSKFAGKAKIGEDTALDIYDQTDPDNFDDLLKNLSA
jgi:hypothetical protein